MKGNGCLRELFTCEQMSGAVELKRILVLSLWKRPQVQNQMNRDVLPVGAWNKWLIGELGEEKSFPESTLEVQYVEWLQ